MRLYVGLVHHPVRNRLGNTVTTAVTNLDVHDMARMSLTYGARGLYIVHPSAAQRELFDRLIAFWRSDTGAHYNADRARALELVRWVTSISDACSQIEQQEGAAPLVATTTALRREGQVGPEHLAACDEPLLLLFGTGHGLAEEVHRMADAVMQPILGAGNGYNHLSVRAAAAITLDRLSGGDTASASRSDK